ncbi:disulfide bond formation protein DsbA [Scytonema hofmannii PCC 7110]|uniref:Disulfide bond formation protein DsbA n=1 Tax=Scytonema hofmannii PCC 7110 TaxID=128403 RepID=A0A139WRT9_9CYAN|nr:DsbA family protein [Scytonema hofmannii]KYC35151.1 disulfide bond formation protein DsbA [Scytonema hofmannii PCC 7110]
MYAFSYLVGKLLVWLRRFAVVGFICLVLSWSLPAQAARMNPQLEQQVLQIIREHPEAIVESVQAYQQKQRSQIQQAQQVFVQQMRTDPLSVIGQSPTTGSKDLKILLVEFSDFECPYCAQAHKTLKQFMVKHQDEVTLVYKHFPLTNVHPQAVPAATAAWAAQQQGKFWEYQDTLFSNQKQLGEQFYLDTAKNLNLDLEKFKSDRLLASAAIEKDSQLAQMLGLSGTPFFIMNGEVLSGAIQLGEIEDLLTRVRKT